MKASDIVRTTLKIDTLDVTEARKLLLAILERHPTAVMKSMKADAVPLFKVVIRHIPEGLMVAAVKVVREITRCALKEAKDFVEGVALIPGKEDMPYGTLAQNITRERANMILEDAKAASGNFNNGSIVLEVVPQDVPWTYYYRMENP
jgi:ribosomal protein L7/L12